MYNSRNIVIRFSKTDYIHIYTQDERERKDKISQNYQVI